MPSRRDAEEKYRDMGVERDRTGLDKMGAQREIPGQC